MAGIFYCHRTCCYKVTLGVILTVLGLGLIVYSGHCERLYAIQSSDCAKVDPEVCNVCNEFVQVCSICSNCTSTNFCPPQSVAGYCGYYCREAEQNVDNWSCPIRTGGAILLIFSIFATIVSSILTFKYFCSEALENITGTQDE